MLKNHPELKTMLSQGGCWFLARMPYLPIPEGVTTREQYRHLTRRRTVLPHVSLDRILHVIALLLLAALWAKGQTPAARATAAAPTYTEKALVPLSVDLTGALRVASSGEAPGGGLTDAQLRATPVPVSATFWQATQPVSGTFWQATQPVSGTFWQATQPVSGTFWQETQPISGTVTANAGTGTFTVSGPLTDTQLRATAVPVSGTVTANAGTGTMNVTCVSGCSTPAENATYVWVTPDVTAGADKLFLDLFNASGSGKIIRVRGIYPTVKTDVAVTGAVSIRFDLYRTSAVGTGGTAAAYNSSSRDVAGGSMVPQDTNNAAIPAQITARHLPTGGATIASWTRRFSCFTEETNASTHLCSGQTNYLDITTGTQLFTLREGQGMLLKQGGVAANNNISFAVLFTLE